LPIDRTDQAPFLNNRGERLLFSHSPHFTIAHTLIIPTTAQSSKSIFAIYCIHKQEAHAAIAIAKTADRTVRPMANGQHADKSTTNQSNGV